MPQQRREDDSLEAEQASLPTTTALAPVLLLSAALLLSWSVYALGVRVHIDQQSALGESLLGAASRCIFWGVPCGIYLWRYWGSRFFEPIGFGFPLGRAQVRRTATVTGVVMVLLVLGTSIQKGILPTQLLALLWQHGGLNLQAPVFEELVFRGVVLSELLNWLHDRGGTRAEVGRRFWAVQLFGASVFLFIHWPWWLSHKGLVETLWVSPPVLLTGLIMGLVYANTRSIWGCIFLHWLNNELSTLG